jgi:hypothetical protein
MSTSEINGAVANIRSAMADLYMMRANFAERMGQESFSDEVRQEIQSHLDALESISTRLDIATSSLRG